LAAAMASTVQVQFVDADLPVADVSVAALSAALSEGHGAKAVLSALQLGAAQDLWPHFGLFYVLDTAETVAYQAPIVHLCSADDADATAATSVLKACGSGTGRLVLKTVVLTVLDQKALLANDFTIDVLFGECRDKVERGGVVATAEQLEQLDEWSDPAFTVKRQYIELVQSLPGYCKLKLQPCTISFQTADAAAAGASNGITAGPIEPWIGLEGFYTQVDAEKTLIQFKHIRRWTIPPTPDVFAECQIALELSIGGDTFVWVTLTTMQAHHIMHLFRRLVQRLQEGRPGVKRHAVADSTASMAENDVFSGI